MQLRTDHCLDECVVLRSELPPGGEAVHSAVGHLALSVEDAALPSPGVGNAVENEHVVAGSFGLVEGRDVLVDFEWRFDVEDVEVDAIGIEDAGVILGVDQCNPPAEAGGKFQRCERLAGSGCAANADAGFLGDALGFLE